MTDQLNSENRINEYTVRFIAGQVFVLAVLTISLHSQTIALFMALDFLLRAFTSQISPLAYTANSLVNLLRLKKKPIFAAPKKFAASIGFIFSLTLFILYFIHFDKAALVIGAILALFAFLEASFRICTGCYLYHLIFSFKIK